MRGWGNLVLWAVIALVAYRVYLWMSEEHRMTMESFAHEKQQAVAGKERKTKAANHDWELQRKVEWLIQSVTRKGTRDQDPRARFLKEGVPCDLINASLGTPDEIKTIDKNEVGKSYQSVDGNNAIFTCFGSAHFQHLLSRGVR